MTTPRSARGLLATLAAAIVIAGCGASDGTEAAESPATTTAPAAAAETTTAPDEEPETEEADPAGAEEVAELTGDYLEESRSQMGFRSTETPEAVQEGLRILRNILYGADGELRKVEVADPDLAALVNDFYVTAGESIATLDEVTTAAPETLGQTEAGLANQALLDALGAAVTVREAALTVATDGTMPDEPSPSEVLAVPADFEQVGGQPAYTMRADPGPPTERNGPCGNPSAYLRVEPRTYAGAYLEDSQVSVLERVLVFDDEDEAREFVDATEEYWDCEAPEGYASTAVDPPADGYGIRIRFADDAGKLGNILVTTDDNRVIVVDVFGDQITSGMPLEITLTHALNVLAVIGERAIG